MKKNLLSGSLGVTIGMLISILTSALFGQGNYYPLNPFSDMGIYYQQHFNQVTVTAISVVIWFAIGVFFQVLDKIQNQDWSLLRMSVTHFILSTLGFSLLAILAGWFPLNLANLLVFWIIYLVIYAIIYWRNYQQMNQQVQAINQSLEK